MDFDPVAYISEPHWLESRLGLDRIQGLLDSLGKPQERLRFVHVAGTNGKGSTCAFLAHILQEAGFRTGLFTSPHIMEFSDRIQVDGTPISSDELLSVTLAVKEKADAMSDHPTEFEIMTAVALEHFARRKCDIVVFEVGLGGRLDATNVVDAPELCVITPVGFDHTEVLGTTLGAIAWEKAGIIKQGVPLVSWPQEKEAMDVISQAAAERQAKLTIVDFACLSVSANAGFKAPRAIDGVQAKNDESAPKGTGQAHASGNAEAEAQAEAERGSQAASPDMHGGHVSRETFVREFSYKGYHDLRIQLLGSYQPFNAALAIEAIDALRDRGWQISEEAMRRGLMNTRWPGRFEVVAQAPTFIIDGSHNPQGAQTLLESLQSNFPDQRPVFIVGVLKDKDYQALLEPLVPWGAAFVVVEPPTKRALPVSDLARAIHSQAPQARLHEAHGFPEAVAQACELAGKEGLVCAFGSLYSIASLKAAVAAQTQPVA